MNYQEEKLISEILLLLIAVLIVIPLLIGTIIKKILVYMTDWCDDGWY